MPSVPTVIQQEIRTRYERRYGSVAIEFNQFLWEKDDTFSLVFTISKTKQFTKRYCGKVGYVSHQLILEVKAL